MEFFQHFLGRRDTLLDVVLEAFVNLSNRYPCAEKQERLFTERCLTRHVEDKLFQGPLTLKGTRI